MTKNLNLAERLEIRNPRFTRARMSVEPIMPSESKLQLPPILQNSSLSPVQKKIQSNAPSPEKLRLSQKFLSPTEEKLISKTPLPFLTKKASESSLENLDLKFDRAAMRMSPDLKIKRGNNDSPGLPEFQKKKKTRNEKYFAMLEDLNFEIEERKILKELDEISKQSNVLKSKKVESDRINNILPITRKLSFSKNKTEMSKVSSLLNLQSVKNDPKSQNDKIDRGTLIGSLHLDLSKIRGN